MKLAEAMGLGGAHYCACGGTRAWDEPPNFKNLDLVNLSAGGPSKVIGD